MGSQVRILLVEDDREIVMFLRDFLVKKRFQVESADG